MHVCRRDADGRVIAGLPEEWRGRRFCHDDGYGKSVSALFVACFGTAACCSDRKKLARPYNHLLANMGSSYRALYLKYLRSDAFWKYGIAHCNWLVSKMRVDTR